MPIPLLKFRALPRDSFTFSCPAEELTGISMNEMFPDVCKLRKFSSGARHMSRTLCWPGPAAALKSTTTAMLLQLYRNRSKTRASAYGLIDSRENDTVDGYRALLAKISSDTALHAEETSCFRLTIFKWLFSKPTAGTQFLTMVQPEGQVLQSQKGLRKGINGFPKVRTSSHISDCSEV